MSVGQYCLLFTCLCVRVLCIFVSYVSNVSVFIRCTFCIYNVLFASLCGNFQVSLDICRKVSSFLFSIVVLLCSHHNNFHNCSICSLVCSFCYIVLFIFLFLVFLLFCYFFFNLFNAFLYVFISVNLYLCSFYSGDFLVQLLLIEVNCLICCIY